MKPHHVDIVDPPKLSHPCHHGQECSCGRSPKDGTGLAILMVGESMHNAATAAVKLKRALMNADNEMIPIVEDDQGEGFKDPVDVFNPPLGTEAPWLTGRFGKRRDTKPRKSPSKRKSRNKMAAASRRKNR